MRSGLIAVVAAVAVTLAACGGDSETGTATGGSAAGGCQEKATIRLGVGDPTKSAVAVTAQHFAEEVKKTSNGNLDVKVFPEGTLFGGDQNAAVNQVQNGSIDATILSTSVYSSFEPRMNAVSLPYLFNDFDQYLSFIEGAPGQTLLKSLEKVNTAGLAMIPRTLRQITNSKRPITQPSDLQGLKLRVPQNELWVEFFKSLGANPTPMDFTEVYTALQLNVIDGQENPVDVPLENKFNEVQKYLSLTGHIADAYILAMNQDKLNGLSAECQKVLREAAVEAAQFKADYDQEQSVKIIEQLKAGGMEVNELTAEQQKAFQEAAQKLYPQFESLIGKEFVDETLKFVGKAQ